ncbi:ino80 complex subunit iec3 [Gigaspora margarita]|uniref:Ino80 complex subunit iec3 n=1 Tax=Gigaspora margarita TaxID=4874 RepID=A0A8H3X3F8_GIGMA|nr:ino80 complex subunit iec3 [Gigaspora margarita]
MADPRSFRDKYYRLREKYDALNKQRDELKQNLEITKHKARKLKEHNNRLLDLMMDMNPSLVDDVSGSSSSDESDVLSDATSDDLDTSITHISRYEQPKQSPREYRRKVSPPTTRKPHVSPQASGSRTTGKRKTDEGIGADELPTQKRRRKAPGVKKKRDDRTDAKRIEPLPMNPDGTLKLPVTIGKGTNEVTIYRIGNIVWDKEAYHTNRYIFPVGFMSKKQYLSAVDVTRRTTYTSEILDGGDTPIFQVTAEDQPGRKFSASSSSGVWKKILDEINIQGVPSKTHASGPEMLGLSHLGITKYIQELPGAEKCTKYVMQRWIDDDQPPPPPPPPMSMPVIKREPMDEEEDDDDDRSAITNGHEQYEHQIKTEASSP